MDAHSIKKLLNNMFIVGFQGEEPSCEIKNAIKNGFGGVIFFSDNIQEREKFKNTVGELKSLSGGALIVSIDQEGGLVERTINLDDKVDYISPMGIAQSDDKSLVKSHYDILSRELSSFGINMNFAPVCDVNTEEKNSIIGIRSFSQNPQRVGELAGEVVDVFRSNGIFSTVKHFPGHGGSCDDSHRGMVVMDLDFDELKRTHIAPFKEAIKHGVDAVMVAHAIYPALDEKNPASLSPVVISYLREQLGFEGVVISDDMVMGAIAKYYSPEEACIKAIDAGVNMLIFRNYTKDSDKLIEFLAGYALEHPEFFEKIEYSNEKILGLKSRITERDIKFDVEDARKKVFEMSKKTFVVLRNNISLSKTDRVLILRPRRENIHSYKTDKFLISDLWELKNSCEIEYSLNPEEEEILSLCKLAEGYERVVFVSYNAVLFEGQRKLISSLKIDAALCAGVPYDNKFFEKIPFLSDIFGYKKYGFLNLRDSLINS